MSDKEFIKIKNVSKNFEEVVAVDNINVDIARGEFFSLLGPSGCGKTTLLRILAGFEYPSSGSVFIDNLDVTDITPNLRPTNMVFQNYAIFPHINVKRNIEFGLRKEKLSKDELDKRVQDALKMVQLEGYEDRYSNQLSGGQRQRIALARALVKQPKVLLLDEPLGALDKKLREEMQLELRNLQRSIGITFIFVTHDQEEAMTMSDRVAVMNKGKILQISPPRDLYDNPKNLFVGDFIGQINFLDTQIVKIEGNNAKVLINKLGEHEIITSNNNLSQNESIVCAIRPETIIISKTNEKNSDICIKGSIVNTSFYGNMTYVYVKIEGLSKPIMVSTSDVLEGLSHNSDCYLNINLKDIRIIQKN
ncbi:MAG: ABC transporter ATP-binding protein [Alphaproteobacteria bacterium]|jgi:spermidine/putrescine transport system ATP-binding protein/putrescine transport system ATP-binding protein|nr:ABC transporter ATP-binding protein [Alphaproteobacteria bacterium]|tara:strand:+ start:85 stop:1173 length:1089 start_codon:yes stop_codon:yes gene_type:complete